MPPPSRTKAIFPLPTSAADGTVVTSARSPTSAGIRRGTTLTIAPLCKDTVRSSKGVALTPAGCGPRRFAERFPYRLELDSVEHVLEEAAQDRRRCRVRLRQAARHRVEELVAVDLADRRTVYAADVVGLDLEAGDRVRVRLRGKEQVPVLLVGGWSFAPRARRGSSRARRRSPRHGVRP